MARPIISLVGKRFGFLVVLQRGENRGAMPYWICICDCGVKKEVQGSHLASGTTRSCGCQQANLIGEGHRTHGETSRKTGRTVEYKAWSQMKHRCCNPNNKRFKDYGGRGITVCARWINSYENFLADMGRRPSKLHSIDRIDNDGNYTPSNCRWATDEQQRHNRRYGMKAMERQ